MSRIRAAVIVVALGLVIATNQVGAQSRGLGRINGTVTSDAGEPISGVIVKVEIGADALTGNSDVNGKWAVAGLGRGEFFAEFSKPGFETKRVRLLVEKEKIESPPIKISLKKTA